jgi:hypothetical protein
MTDKLARMQVAAWDLPRLLPTECAAALAAYNRLNGLREHRAEDDWLVVLDQLLVEGAEPEAEQGILQAAALAPAQWTTMVAPLYLTLLYANQGRAPTLDEMAEALGKLELAAKK